MTAVAADAAQRELITTQTGATLFVNAGAGSGKTAALVRRVLTLVLDDGVPLAHIAAVTFTEKAGAELRDRLRVDFEKQVRSGPPARATDARQALDDLDGAAIGTLHAFAQRILMEHPIEAGLPPIIEVLDEVGSSVAFEERWSELQSALLDDDQIAEALLLGLGVGMTLKHVRALAILLGKDWDLIEERVLAAPAPQIRMPDLDDFTVRARRTVDQVEHCTADDDKLRPRLVELEELLAHLAAAPDRQTRITVLHRISKVKNSLGRGANWTCPVAEVRTSIGEITQFAADAVAGVLDQCLRQVTQWLATRVLESAQLRRSKGELEFHDLLVLSRNLLRRDETVRAALHENYQRLLLDEFQDTDPIQIELATRICGGRPAAAPRWQDVTIPPGRLFVVGDAKQSIYRFRRASIATYLEAEANIGQPVTLTTNFRTVAPILDWINSVFGALITHVPEGQPGYVALDHYRQGSGRGPAVTVLGGLGHDDKPTAAVLREREAADVADVIRHALDDGWQVFDQATAQWRPARRADIAVLVPARTSLPFLEEALQGALIPYRAEASSLVYQAAEVRDLLTCARAIADTSDSLALVTTLRSPLFGCGDDDLWRWKHARGSFSLFSELDPAEPIAAGPVGRALKDLRNLYFQARWMTPSEVLGAIMAERRMFEVAATGPRARDSWRRLRFVVDQARAWSEVSHGGLRAYLAWAAHQGQEASRVAEATLPETDADSVRVMTIHAAKGLEFPIVILSGMTALGRNNGGTALLWPREGGYQARLTTSVQTGDFQAAVPLDEQMDGLEKKRLLYVAATRARDHLVVSLHRKTGSSAQTAANLLADAGAVTATGGQAFAGFDFGDEVDAPGVPVTAPPPFDDWSAAVETARAGSRRSAAITASGLEGTEPEVILDAGFDAGLAKGGRDLDLPPWTKGRYGSAIGRAVHAVLQVVDLGTGAGTDTSVAAQCVVEGVTGQEPLVRALVESALTSALVRRAAERPNWRETYVGTVRADGVVLEGMVDLVYREEDGSLVIVDYKTDAVPAGAIASRVVYYRPQMDAYCEALAAATGDAVSATLLFLNPETSVAVPSGAHRPAD